MGTVKLPLDMPFYPGTWLVGFAILGLAWIEWGGGPAVGLFLAFLVLQAVVAEIWAALERPKRSS